MSAFIESFSTQQLLPPWISEGARAWSFLIDVPTQCIQAYLDTHFNAPGRDTADRAPYRFAAIPELSTGILSVEDHTKFSSGAVGTTGWDLLAHRAVYWTVPVLRHRITPDNLLVEPTVVWVQPFAFEDNSYVMFSAREIWGTDVTMAQIDYRQGATPADLQLDVSIAGFKQFDPRAHSGKIGVIQVRLKDDAKVLDPAVIQRDAADLARLLQALDAAGGAGPASCGAEPASAPSLPAGGEINTLKQFRDVFNMQDAAYRALIASRTVRTNQSQAAIYSGDSVTIDFLWSDSMAEKFVRLFGLSEPEADGDAAGIPPETGAEAVDWNLPRVAVKARLALAYHFDARFDVLRTLYVYGQ